MMCEWCGRNVVDKKFCDRCEKEFIEQQGDKVWRLRLNVFCCPICKKEHRTYMNTLDCCSEIKLKGGK
jgi:hypothetical protein